MPSTSLSDTPTNNTTIVESVTSPTPSSIDNNSITNASFTASHQNGTKIQNDKDDFDAAARYYARANLADPSDIQLMERAAISFFALGEVARSARFSELLETAGQRDSQISNLVLATSLRAPGDWATLQSRFGSGQRSGPLT